jgi:hypothetical protein
MIRAVVLACGLLATACKDDKPATTTEKLRAMQERAIEKVVKDDEDRIKRSGENTKRHAAEEAAAEKAAAEAAKVVEEAHARVAKLEAEGVELSKELEAAKQDVEAAKSKHDTDAAVALLTQMNARYTEHLKRLLEAKQVVARAERTKGVTISKECQDNPLAAGCT